MNFTSLPIDVINYMMLICDYKSILFMYCTCKRVNNIDLETILVTKSRLIKNTIGNVDHLIPLSIVYNKENLLCSDNMIIAYLKYLFDNNFNLAHGDKILPDNRNSGCVGALGFSGCKGIITTKYGDIITPTYKIFQKFLQFKFY